MKNVLLLFGLDGGLLGKARGLRSGSPPVGAGGGFALRNGGGLCTLPFTWPPFETLGGLLGPLLLLFIELALSICAAVSGGGFGGGNLVVGGLLKSEGFTGLGGNAGFRLSRLPPFRE